MGTCKIQTHPLRGTDVNPAGSDTSPREEQLHACLVCHAVRGESEKIIGFIGSPHDRRTMNCSTCHTVHAETDPIAERGNQAATCNRCHRRQMENHPRFEDKSIDFDTLACSTCHDVHLALAEEAPPEAGRVTE
jgi:predicted CXXCH cytochrome family protein